MTSGSISDSLRAKIRTQARNRCGYCLTRQEYIPWTLEIEHIIPKSKGGSDHLDNLQPMCAICNNIKGNTMPNDTSEAIRCKETK